MPKKLAARLLGAAALLAFAGTTLAARIDFWRRHRPGITPARYWIPQVVQIWLPGLGAAAILAILCALFWRASRPQKQ